MKTIKNTNSFYVLGVKFENVQEAIEYAINEMDKMVSMLEKMLNYILVSTQKTMRQKTDSLEYSVCKI